MKSASQKPVDALIMRQNLILKGLSGYFKVTFAIGALGFIATNIVKLFSGEQPSGVFAVSGNIALARLIQIALTILSELVMWLFVIWAATLIPYMAFRSFRISRNTTLEVQPLRWIQLAAALILPLAVFALAWTTWESTGVEAGSLPSFPFSMIVIPLLGGCLVGGSILGASRLLTAKRIELQLSIITGVLLLSIFLTYAVGWASVAQAALFGILMSLAISHREVEAAFRRLAVYDVDPKIADRLQQLAERRQGIRLQEDEIALEQEAQELGVRESRQSLEARRLRNEQELNQQAVKVEETRTELMQKHNEVAISAYEQKLAFLSTAHDVLTQELARRLEEFKDHHVNQLKKDASTYEPQQLTSRIKEIMQEVSSDDELPKALGEIRRQMLVLTEELRQTTLQVQDLRNGEDGDRSESPILARMLERRGLLPQHFERAIAQHGVAREQLGLWEPTVQAAIAKGLECCQPKPRYERYGGLWVAESAHEVMGQYDGLLGDLWKRMDESGRIDGANPIAGDPDSLFYVTSTQPCGLVSAILSYVTERPIILAVAQE